MRVSIARVDPSLPLPTYATEGSLGFDLYARAQVIVTAHALMLIPTNIIVAVPEGYVLMVSLRSSTPRRLGLLCPHGVGIIDRDYCGPGDEIQVQVYNIRNESVTVERGERFAQGMLLRTATCTWEEQPVAGPSRGGFGSTG